MYKLSKRLVILNNSHQTYLITNIAILVLLLISLSSCRTANSIPTMTATTHLTPTDIPRWQLYERALLEATIKMDGLCEWVILGVSGQRSLCVHTLSGNRANQNRGERAGSDLLG